MAERRGFGHPLVSASCRFPAGGGDADQSAWQTVAADVSASKQAPGDWHAEFECMVSTPGAWLQELRVTVRIPATRFWTLCANRTLAPGGRAKVRPPFPVGRFVVVEDEHGQVARWEFPQSGPLTIGLAESFVTIDFVPHNRRGAGLSHWGSRKWLPAPAGFRFEMLADRLDSPSDCIWAEPFPEGSLSALCLTDHADYDQEAKQRLFNELFLRTGFRLTKSVFPKSDPHPKDPSKREPGLDDAGFLKQIRELHAHGSEIAFHGFGPRRNAPPASECALRSDLMNEFQPRTWIDHGTGDYLFSRTETLPDGTPLTGFLQPRGVINYWSYFDYWVNPCHRLKGWEPAAAADAGRDIRAGWSIEKALTARQRLYLLSNGVKSVVGEPAFDKLRQGPLRPGNWSNLLSQGAALQALQREPMVIYTRTGGTFLSDLDGTWVFDTVLLNHLAWQLSPMMSEGLAASSTVLIGHCYLGAQFPHMAATAMERDRLHLGFVEGIEHIQGLQTGRRLVSLPFQELRSSLTAFARTRTIRGERGWQVICTAPRQARMYVGASAVTAIRIEGAGDPIRVDGGRILMPVGDTSTA